MYNLNLYTKTKNRENKLEKNTTLYSFCLETFLFGYIVGWGNIAKTKKGKL